MNSAERPEHPAFANGQWSVTAYGLECNDGTYPIPKHRFQETTDRGAGPLYVWPVHLAEKTWVDMPSFLEAFRRALEHHRTRYDPAMLARSEAHARRVREEDEGFERKLREKGVREGGGGFPLLTTDDLTD
jgi:hypothetical protein